MYFPPILSIFSMKVFEDHVYAGISRLLHPNKQAYLVIPFLSNELSKVCLYED